MSKNFFSLRTGHGPSDEYFKNAAIWHDIDLLKAYILGAGTSSLILFCIWALFN
jgi:hypothetical protein